MMSDLLYLPDYLPEYEEEKKLRAKYFNIFMKDKFCKRCEKTLFDLTITGTTKWDGKKKLELRYKCFSCPVHFYYDFDANQPMIFNEKKGEWVLDKEYKKLGKEAKKIEKDTKAVLKKDKARDKIIDKAKEMKKKGC